MKAKTKDLIRLDAVVPLLVELTGMTRNRSTIYNWVQKGRHGQHGTVVHLKAIKRLGVHYTTKQWVIDYIAEIG